MNEYKGNEEVNKKKDWVKEKKIFDAVAIVIVCMLILFVPVYTLFNFDINGSTVAISFLYMGLFLFIIGIVISARKFERENKEKERLKT